MISRHAFLSALACLPYVGTYLSAALTAGDAECRLVHAPREVRSNGMRMRFVRQWDVVKDSSPMRADGYMCEDGQIRFMLSRDGGKTWEPNGAPVSMDDLPRIKMRS